MADKGKRDKGKREQQKKAKLTPKEKRQQKRDKKKSTQRYAKEVGGDANRQIDTVEKFTSSCIIH